MHRRLLLLLSLGLVTSPATAQVQSPAAAAENGRRIPRTVPLPTTPPPLHRRFLNAGFGAEVGGDRELLSPFAQGTLAFWKLRRLDAGGRFWLGGGPRLTIGRAEQGTYLARQTQAVPYQLAVTRPRQVALNVAIHAQVCLTHWLRVGGSLDLVGHTWGGEQAAYRAYTHGPNPDYDPTIAARPQRGNLLLGGKADRGTLTSEAYISLGLTGRACLQVGVYHTATSFVSEGERFQRFYTLPTAGLSYALSQ